MKSNFRRQVRSSIIALGHIALPAVCLAQATDGRAARARPVVVYEDRLPPQVGVRVVDPGDDRPIRLLVGDSTSAKDLHVALSIVRAMSSGAIPSGAQQRTDVPRQRGYLPMSVARAAQMRRFLGALRGASRRDRSGFGRSRTLDVDDEMLRTSPLPRIVRTGLR